MAVDVVTVAGGVVVVLASILPPVGARVHPAHPHVLWSRHLLLRRRHGDDGNHRESHLGSVRCSQLSLLILTLILFNTTILLQPFTGRLSGTTRVGRYQKKHLPAHTHPGQCTSFITFLH